MASTKENLKALFSNTRSRVIILFTAAILFFAVGLGIYKLVTANRSAVSSMASLTSAPAGIQSVPGALNPTAQYASLQETQNVQQAQQAIKSGSSAIPTIIRTQAFGQGVQPISAPPGEGGVGFETLAREESGGNQRSLWIQTLKKNQCNKTTVQQIVNEGATIRDLRTGCNCEQLKDDGYSLKDLTNVCLCVDLKSAGFTALDLKNQDYSAEQLRTCGFSACNLKSAGFDAQAMKDGGYSDGELKGAGFPEDAIAKASGLPEGITPDDILKAGCGTQGLEKLRAAGVTAAAIRRISGCRIEQFKAAGFTPKNLRDAGFSAAELKNAGFTPEQLRAAGYMARNLLNAGFTPAQLAAAGFTPGQIQAGEAELPPGVTPENVKESGCTVGALGRERLAGVSAALIRQYAGCGATALKTAGFTDGDLQDAGFTPTQIQAAQGVSDDLIRAAGCDPNKLKSLLNQGVSATRIRTLNGCSAATLKAAGFGASQLLAAGFTPEQLVAAGFTPEEIESNEPVTDAVIREAGCDVTKLKALYAEGVSAARIHSLNGCNASTLNAVGFDARQLAAAGFSPEELSAAGFNPREIQSVEPTSDAAIRAAGCDPAKLSTLNIEGVSAARIKQLNGCSAEALKAAGFSAKALSEAGFTPAQLLSAGFTPAQVQAAQVVPDGAIQAAGCNPATLKEFFDEGVAAKRIHALNGCNAADLKAAGYSAKALEEAGFTPAQLLAAHFTPAEIAALSHPPTAEMIKAAGCDVARLKTLYAEGVSAADIEKQNNCPINALKAAGFNAKQLAEAGFVPEQLLAAGFSPSTVKAADALMRANVAEAGCDASKLAVLRKEGITAQVIQQTTGCPLGELKAAGFDAAALSRLGYTPQQLLAAGFTPDELKAELPVNASTIKAADCDANDLYRLRQKGVTALQIKSSNGCNAATLKKAGYSAADLLNAGYTPDQLAQAGFSPAQIQSAIPLSDESIKAADCDPAKLSELRKAGVSASRIRQLNGCSLAALKQAGYDAKSLANAGFTPEQLLMSGFTPDQLIHAGLSPASVIAAGRTADCSAASLKAAHAMGVLASTIKQTLGCNATALKNGGYTAEELRKAGFSAAELRNAGFTAAQLRDAGFTAKELEDAGFSAAELKNAGFTAAQLRAAEFSADQLKNAGFTPSELKQAGYSADAMRKAGLTANQLKQLGYTADALKEAGYTVSELRQAGLTPTELSRAGFSPEQLLQGGFTNQDLQNAGIPIPLSSVSGLQSMQQLSNASTVTAIPGVTAATSPMQTKEAANVKQLQDILNRQQSEVASQRYQQAIQQRTSAMLSAANQSLQNWKNISPQIYVASTVAEKTTTVSEVSQTTVTTTSGGRITLNGNAAEGQATIKTGDVIFAVLDTAVNSDEPGPILATIVSGKLSGTKLIGSFNLPANADKMIISFNTMSIPGLAHTVPVSAYAIDPDTARTALSSSTNHHYLVRYGSLFAATFLEGFGNAFQSANTTVTIGGTGGMTNTTVSNGIGRSVLENAVIGLATLGKNWGQVAQQQFNRPTTVQVCSGTALGILFTQDVTL